MSRPIALVAALTLALALGCAGGEAPPPEVAVVVPVPVEDPGPEPRIVASAPKPPGHEGFAALSLPYAIDASKSAEDLDIGALPLTQIQPWLTDSEKEGQIEPPVKPLGRAEIGGATVWLAVVDLPWGGGVTSYRALVGVNDDPVLHLTELASNEGVYCEGGTNVTASLKPDGALDRVATPWTQNCDEPDEPITRGAPTSALWRWNGKGWDKGPVSP